MKNKNLILTMLLVIVAMLFCPTKVFAASTIERTTTLDVSAFTKDEESKEEGWSWNSSTNTLTLTDVNFNTGANNSIVLPYDRDIYIVSNGNNKLTSKTTVICDKQEGPGTIIFSGDGLLELNSKGELPTMDANSLLFKSGTVKAIGGSIITGRTIKIVGGNVNVDTSLVSSDGWTDGLYACGGIEISGGKVDITSNRVGIFATGTAHPNPTTGVKITGGDVNISAKVAAIYSGIDNKKDTYINTTGTIDFKDSKIGIYVYDGDLTIEKGNFISNEDCKLYVMHPDNTGVKNVAKADYTKVNEAKTKVPADLSVYTDESVKVLQDALNAVVEDKNATEQIAVNGYAKAIEDAIAGLKYKAADYTKVNEVKAKVPSDLTVYTDETVKKLQDAINAVVEGKNITEQTTVDNYAEAIEDAITGLKYKDADYTKVNEAKSKVPADLSIYTDESVKALQDALNAVVEDKNITEQSLVDNYAKIIEDALDNLERKQYTFKVLSGDKGVFEKTVDNALSIRIDHEFTENVRVEVDGKEVDKTNYKVTKGSTVVTFNKEYLESLAVGNHEVKVYFEDGIATSTITVKEKDQAVIKETPKEEKGTVNENKKESKKVNTGDDTNILGVSLLLVGSLVGLIYLRKKKIV